MLVDETEKKARIRYEKNVDFEIYDNVIDVDYDSEDGIFTGWLY